MAARAFEEASRLEFSGLGIDVLGQLIGGQGVELGRAERRVGRVLALGGAFVMVDGMMWMLLS